MDAGAVYVFTPVPTVATVESPLTVPLVSSTDVRVPIASYNFV